MKLGSKKPTASTLRLLACAALSLLLLAPQLARADEKTVANPEHKAAQEELDRIAGEYSALAEQQDATLSQLEDVRKQIADNENKQGDVRKEIESSQADLDKKKEALSGQISSDYKSGGVSLLSIILSSDSIEDVVSRVYYHSVICGAEASKIDEVNTAREKLQKQVDELESLEGDLRQKESDLDALYGEQRSRTEEMHSQQVAAANLVQSLPAELKKGLSEETEELIADAQPLVDEKKEEEQKQEAKQSEAQQEEREEQSQQRDEEESQPTAKPSNNSNKPSSRPKTNGGGSQSAVLDAAYSTGGGEALGNGWGCAGWVYCVFRDSGVYDRKPTCAAWYYNNWCYSSDRSELEPGMVIAVSTWTGTAAGKRYGHVGIYIGNNTVRHLSAGAVREMSLDTWINQYGTTVTPRWGWNGGIALS